VPLTGARRVRSLGGRRRARVFLTARIPERAAAGGRLSLVACVDSDHKLPEANERNNCRGARRSVVVAGDSSFERIRADEQLNRLSAEKGLLYKLLAAFRDRRLPRRYRGDRGEFSATALLAEAQHMLPRLSRRARAEVRPFLIPPIYRGSWAQLRTAHFAAGQSEEFRPCTIDRRLWSTSEAMVGDEFNPDGSPKLPVRFWWKTQSGYSANSAKELAEQLRSKDFARLATLMGVTQLVSDRSLPCGGIDDRLDIYVHPDAAPATASLLSGDALECPATPSYVQLQAGARRGDLAHELMHVLSNTKPRRGSCRGWLYLDEMTATWAEDYVFPNDNSEHTARKSKLITNPALELWAGYPFPETSDYPNGYPAWTFLYSVTKVTNRPDIVREIYEYARDRRPLDALESALPGGLSKRWPAFARFAWNRELKPQGLVESFFSWDRLTARPSVDVTSLRLRGGRVLRQPLPIELKPLGKQYWHIDLSDRKARRIVYRHPRPLRNGLIHTHAFVKLAGRGWHLDNWTLEKEQEFCRDDPAEDVEELVIVHSLARRPDAADGAIFDDRPHIELHRKCEQPPAEPRPPGSADFRVTFAGDADERWSQYCTATSSRTVPQSARWSLAGFTGHVYIDSSMWVQGEADTDLAGGAGTGTGEYGQCDGPTLTHTEQYEPLGLSVGINRELDGMTQINVTINDNISGGQPLSFVASPIPTSTLAAGRAFTVNLAPNDPDVAELPNASLSGSATLNFTPCRRRGRDCVAVAPSRLATAPPHRP
jgi:hypothetical protein